jgi:hypothetical protein
MILPKSVRNALGKISKKQYWDKGYAEQLNKFSEVFFKERQLAEKKIPSVDLRQQHIQNLQIILNRNDLLALMPKGSVCAEIGVDKGEFSELILSITEPKKLHLIDAWGDSGRYHDGLKLMVEDKFANEIKAGRIEINIGYSTDVLAKKPDAYFDWVYIDTDHSYKTTARELAILNKKVKPGGIICGHDYIMGNWIGGIRYGVMEAVHEFCLNKNWELIYITVNKNEMPSFAIRRIR